MIILIAIAAFISTLVGGLFALRFRDKLHLILGFSAGAVIAVAFFDLMPEALDLGSGYFDTSTIPTLIAVGFIAYLILDRTIFLHIHSHTGSDDHAGHEHREETAPRSRPTSRGVLGAGSLCIHSFLDGVAIGLAFQVSAVIGTIVAVAVLVHDFSDGINTVSLIVQNEGKGVFAFRWLIADAVAPILGVISTLFFTLPQRSLAVILSLFCGFFLYIGTSDLIPESHHAHPRMLTTVMTVLGVALMYIVIHYAAL